MYILGVESPCEKFQVFSHGLVLIPYHLLLCICKENPLALTLFHQPRVTGPVRFCIPDFRSLPKEI